MCTAISCNAKNHYFGRTLDLEYNYNESVIITPRNYNFNFKMTESINNHYAIIGIGIVADDYPLYYEATNEKGLSIAGLNFPTTAVYQEVDKNKTNISAFELIPWILSKCATVDEARELLETTNIVALDFNDNFKTASLHWMISDKNQSVTVESVQEGLKIYYNAIGVMTNNPDFPKQIFNLNNYMSLTNEEPETRFSNELNLNNYSRGMGAIGLPGDYSSMSRFVKATFVKLNSVFGETEEENVNQFFHILNSVSMPKGAVKIGDNYDKTVYTSCCNTDNGIYYYTTYNNSQITAVDMHKEKLDKSELINYNLIVAGQINYQN